MGDLKNVSLSKRLEYTWKYRELSQGYRRWFLSKSTVHFFFLFLTGIDIAYVIMGEPKNERQSFIFLTVAIHRQIAI